MAEGGKEENGVPGQGVQRRIKLFWDFRGPLSAGTAEHFHIHLCEFLRHSEVKEIDTGWQEMGPDQHAVYLVIEESDLPEIKAALKPQRGLYI